MKRLLSLMIMILMFVAFHTSAIEMAHAKSPLGSVWQEKEGGWNGVWTRRARTNIFDAVWTRGASRVTAVLTITRQGSAVYASRTQGSDGVDCEYSGTLSKGGDEVYGYYRCTNQDVPMPWQASVSMGQGRHRRPKGAIQVVTGSYGLNCGMRRGNVTDHLAATCNGKQICHYTIDYSLIGDPAPDCGKDYVAEWRCGNLGAVQSVSAAAEAGRGTTIALTCESEAAAPAPYQSNSVLKTFTDPAIDGYRLDYCYQQGTNCGKKAADEFCWQKGYLKATDFTGPDGEARVTKNIGSGQLCQGVACKGFSRIRCQ